MEREISKKQSDPSESSIVPVLSSSTSFYYVYYVFLRAKLYYKLRGIYGCYFFFRRSSLLTKVGEMKVYSIGGEFLFYPFDSIFSSSYWDKPSFSSSCIFVNFDNLLTLMVDLFYNSLFTAPLSEFFLSDVPISCCL